MRSAVKLTIALLGAVGLAACVSLDESALLELERGWDASTPAAAAEEDTLAASSAGQGAEPSAAQETAAQATMDGGADQVADAAVTEAQGGGADSAEPTAQADADEPMVDAGDGTQQPDAVPDCGQAGTCCVEAVVRSVGGVQHERFDGALSIGDPSSQPLSLIDASTATMRSDYPAAWLGCGVQDATADAVYQWSAAQDARVRLSLLAQDWPAAVSVFDAPLPVLTSRQLAASDLDPALQAGCDDADADAGSPCSPELGPLEARAIAVDLAPGTVAVFEGDISEAPADLDASLLDCGAQPSRGAVVFSIAVTRPTAISVDTTGSAASPVLLLFDEEITEDGDRGCAGAAELDSSGRAEFTLWLGTYHLVLTAGQGDGRFRVAFRDDNRTPLPAPLGCASSGTPLELDMQSGRTYYAVVHGTAAGAAGAYSLELDPLADGAPLRCAP